MFVPCDLEIWWMTLKNNRAPLLCCFKFVHHFIAINEFKLELQSGNTQFGSKSMVFLSRETLKFDRWPWKLEQLERLRSEDTPRRLMITHTIESYWIPSQKKTKSKLQIEKRTLHATHLLKLLDKMCNYEIDPSIVEDTERTRFCPQTDRRTRWYQYTPLSTSLKRGV